MILEFPAVSVTVPGKVITLDMDVAAHCARVGLLMSLMGVSR